MNDPDMVPMTPKQSAIVVEIEQILQAHWPTKQFDKRKQVALELWRVFRRNQ